MKTGKNSTTPPKTLSRPDREGLLVPDLERKDFPQFGQYLRRERDMRGITLAEIAQTTRINQRYLVAIEEGRDADLPAVPFVKGFISAYARHIGLNPEEVLGFYDEVRARQAEVAAEVAAEPAPGRSGRRVLGWTLAVALLVAVAGAGAWWWSGARREAAPPPAEETAAAPEAAAPAPEQAEAPAPALVPESIPEPLPAGGILSPSGGVELVLEANDKSWVYAILDEQNVKDFFLNAGEKSELKAGREIKLTLGNAGGVGITFNGKKVEALGRPGEVKRDVIFYWDATRGAEVRDPFRKPQENAPGQTAVPSAGPGGTGR